MIRQLYIFYNIFHSEKCLLYLMLWKEISICFVFRFSGTYLEKEGVEPIFSTYRCRNTKNLLNLWILLIHSVGCLRKIYHLNKNKVFSKMKHSNSHAQIKSANKALLLYNFFNYFHSGTKLLYVMLGKQKKISLICRFYWCFCTEFLNKTYP